MLTSRSPCLPLNSRFAPPSSVLDPSWMMPISVITACARAATVSVDPLTSDSTPRVVPYTAPAAPAAAAATHPALDTDIASASAHLVTRVAFALISPPGDSAGRLPRLPAGWHIFRIPPGRLTVATFLKTTEISIDGARTLPREYYTSPELFAEEHERIFTKRWLCVGREDRIPNPGDWFTQEIGKESIIVLRGKEG